MKSDVENKLDRIANIWNNFICEFRFCRQKINFTNDIKSNYLGEILGYFQDTFDIIFAERNTKSYVDIFSYHMSLLQAIYIQQDFIEELLIIFKCDIVKGDLIKDENYSVNREIRNELVGHPIRKMIPDYDKEINKCECCGNLINSPKKKLVLLSSTLFSYDSDNDTIQYLRYHKDNNYKFETLSYKIADVILRHNKFLNRYFDKIFQKLILILKKYDKELTKITDLIEKQDFEIIIKLVGIYYESILKSDFIYDEGSLIKVYNCRTVHIRYQNLIERFYSDLKIGIIDTKKNIQDLIEPKPIVENFDYPKIEISYIDFNNGDTTEFEERKEIYHNLLGKLASKRNSKDFEFFSSLLKSKCSNNKLVIDELKHMENNIYNEIEYYTAFRLICKELNE